jgi:hypothetical protein
MHQKICARCLLPSSYPGIRFDGDGACQFCNGTEQEFEYIRKSKADLDRLVLGVKGKNPQYDAIVGVSGGKDSSYVAYYLRKEYGLKILGVNYDIGYRSEYALRNIEAMADRLDMDLLVIRPNTGLMHRLFARFLKQKGEFCSVCNNLGYIIMISLAFRERRLTGFPPLMVGGWSKQYEYQPGVSVTNMRYFFSNLGDELLQELKESPFIEEKVVHALQRVGDPRQAMVGTEANEDMGEFAIQGVQLPDYVEWNVLRFPDILKREIGWQQPGRGHDSHFDCTLFPLKEYLKHRKYGLTQETIKNSRLIREGSMTRDEGLKLAGLAQTTEPPALADFLQTLGLKKDDVAWEADWSTD